MKLVLYDGPSDTLNTVVECRIGQLMMSGHAVQPHQLPPGSCELTPATMDRVLYYKHLDFYVRRNGAWHLGRVAVWDGPPPEWHELPPALLFYVENDTVDHGLAMFRRVDDPLFPYPDHPMVPLFLSGKRRPGIDAEQEKLRVDPDRLPENHVIPMNNGFSITMQLCELVTPLPQHIEPKKVSSTPP